jgi:mycothiol synthase
VHDVEVIHQPLPEHLAAITELVAVATAANGFRPLDDQHWLELTHGGDAGFVGILVWNADRTLDGYAQLSHGNDSVGLQVVLRPEGPEVGLELVQAAQAAVAERGGALVNWWVFHATSDSPGLPTKCGFTAGRALLQMRRPLPVGQRSAVTTRGFRVGHDEADWVSVNNRAFADHLEQGGWTVDEVTRREAEPWFNPDGFRIYDIDGRMAAFCWTKIHPADSADSGGVMLGEIYVIAVDPDFVGQGLGRALTLAGLDWLADHDVPMGMLYVDAANKAAVGLYESLGFEVHHRDQAFVAEVAASTRPE